jgi:hypothetical protein
MPAVYEISDDLPMNASIFLLWLGIITLIHVNILLFFVWYNVIGHILKRRRDRYGPRRARNFTG